MAIILTIGYQDYLMKSEAAAAVVVKCMASAIRLESTCEGGRYIYSPSLDRTTDVRLQVIPNNQLRQRPVTVHCESGEAVAAVLYENATAAERREYRKFIADRKNPTP